MTNFVAVSMGENKPNTARKYTIIGYFLGLFLTINLIVLNTIGNFHFNNDLFFKDIDKVI